MTLAIAVVLFLIALANVVAQLMTHWRCSINTPIFMAQIEKLVYMNNIDRAIKLCNAERSALTSRALRELLVRANRTEELDLVYEEQGVMLDAHEQRIRRGTRTERILEIILLVLFAFISVVGTRDESAIAFLWVSFAGVAMIAGWGIRVLNVRHALAARGAALKLRNLLYQRAGYTPPQHRPPRKMNPEEVAAWRAEHTRFGTGIATLREQGDQRPAHEIHAERVDDRGVLKPL
ncbi:hypothetical protein HY480_02490 [Candidatus Uhrbacteria bacterium]|nr:hypothetical protein [Candidatus Uhrbacteria bacterium]